MAISRLDQIRNQVAIQTEENQKRQEGSIFNDVMNTFSSKITDDFNDAINNPNEPIKPGSYANFLPGVKDIRHNQLAERSKLKIKAWEAEGPLRARELEETIKNNHILASEEAMKTYKEFKNDLSTVFTNLGPKGIDSLAEKIKQNPEMINTIQQALRNKDQILAYTKEEADKSVGQKLSSNWEMKDKHFYRVHSQMSKNLTNETNNLKEKINSALGDISYEGSALNLKKLGQLKTAKPEEFSKLMNRPDMITLMAKLPSEFIKNRALYDNHEILSTALEKMTGNFNTALNEQAVKLKSDISVVVRRENNAYYALQKAQNDQESLAKIATLRKALNFQQTERNRLNTELEQLVLNVAFKEIVRSKIFSKAHFLALSRNIPLNEGTTQNLLREATLLSANDPELVEFKKRLESIKTGKPIPLPSSFVNSNIQTNISVQTPSRLTNNPKIITPPKNVSKKPTGPIK